MYLTIGHFEQWLLAFIMMDLSFVVSKALKQWQPFTFPCNVDVCTFPDQYCSNKYENLRCEPCSKIVCAQEVVPQQCKYNCSVSLGIDRQMASGVDSFLVLSIVEGVIILVIVVACGIKFGRIKLKGNSWLCCWQKPHVLSSGDSASETALIQPHPKTTDEIENGTKEGSYCDRMKAVIPTSTSEKEHAGVYKPTTTVSKITRQRSTSESGNEQTAARSSV